MAPWGRMTGFVRRWLSSAPPRISALVVATVWAASIRQALRDIDRAEPLASLVGKLGNGLGKQYSRSTMSRIAGALSAEGPAGPSSFVQGIHLRSCWIAGLSTWTRDRVARWALGEPCTSLSRRRM